jgi:DNA mismatch repair protein MutS
LADEQAYCRPQVDGSVDFAITGGRHPVVEQALRKAAQNPFVANDCDLSPLNGAKNGGIWLLTGPNMGGKSTFLRQNALIAILAQMGSYVPATEARIGVVDRLFSRVGASDDLARGRSTFMVEMVETAAILNQATPKSLVILDEIGRGTATFDGLSIAWAAVEHLHEVNRCRSLFATHFHELTVLSEKLPRLANVTMRVKEWDGDVVFLHEVGPGAADRSYGIQVARLAGLPPAVVSRAREVLDLLEDADRKNPAAKLIDDLPLFQAAIRREEPKVSAKVSAIEDHLRTFNPDDMTPREALEALYALKKLLS